MQKVSAAKVTLTVHKGISSTAIEVLTKIGVKSVLIESARCVRQSIVEKPWWFVGNNIKLIDFPTEIFRFIVPRGYSERVVATLIKELDLKTPGRGSIYSQNIESINCEEADIKVGTDSEVTMKNLMLMTGIQTKSGSGKNLSKVALKLGVGVPVVGIGIGSGIRDRLGLLRITISPEKEIVYLMVPSHDSVGLQSLLIDEGKLNQPGGGFLYQTPISFGMVDPLIRIGQQEHAASYEQIIAAIDDLNKSTEWRKRFFGVNIETTKNTEQKLTHKEICLTCPLDTSDDYIQTAMNCGADGATTTHSRQVILDSKDEETNSINMESSIMCVTVENEEKIIQALCKVANDKQETNWFIQITPASSVFFYKRK